MLDIDPTFSSPVSQHKLCFIVYPQPQIIFKQKIWLFITIFVQVLKLFVTYNDSCPNREEIYSFRPHTVTCWIGYNLVLIRTNARSASKKLND